MAAVKVHNRSQSIRYKAVALLVGLLLTVQPPGTVAAEPPAPELLARYHQALQGLKLPGELRYTQQIQTVGWQEGIAIADFHFRTDGSWEANVIETDRFHRLESSQVTFVDHGDRLRMYSEYIEHPERLAPRVTIELDATPETYTAGRVERIELAGEPVYHLRLSPTRDGQLRELWLDTRTALPRRVRLSLSGVWGVANGTLDFQPLTGSNGEAYWLPLRTRMEIRMNFWIPLGFTRRVFNGPIDIGSLYGDYRTGADASAPLPTVPNVVNAPPVVSIPAPEQTQSPSASLGKPLELSISTQTSNSILSDRIAQFNLTKPDLSDPKTHINIFTTLKIGGAELLLYTFRFDSKQTLVPLEPANTQGDAIKLFEVK